MLCRAILQPHNLFRGEVKFQPSLAAAGLKASLICEKLAKLGQLTDCDPRREQLDEIDKLDCLRFRLATDQPLEAVQDRLRVAGVLEARVEMVQGTAVGWDQRASSEAGPS